MLRADGTGCAPGRQRIRPGQRADCWAARCAAAVTGLGSGVAVPPRSRFCVWVCATSAVSTDSGSTVADASAGSSAGRAPGPAESTITRRPRSVSVTR